jgi:hypothetical protein
MLICKAFAVVEIISGNWRCAQPFKNMIFRNDLSFPGNKENFMFVVNEQ